MKSLELNWVRNEDKSLVLPEVHFSDIDNVGGYYIPASDGEVLIDDRYYDKRNGVIVISSQYPDDIPSVLAHEWRHHWQHFQGWKYDGIGWDSPVNYDAAIYDYFTQSYSEFDAFRFQCKKAKSETDDIWLDILNLTFDS
jgi:hypothetical protein